MRKIIKIKQSDLLNLVESKLYKIIGQDGKVKATELNHNLAMKVNDSFDGQIIPIDEDLVSGGKADNMSLEDIAKRFQGYRTSVPISFRGNSLIIIKHSNP